jgi:hypothetical protein
MIVISPTEIKNDLKKEIKSMRHSEIHFIKEKRTITNEDLERGLTADELLNRIRPKMKALFEK